MPTITPVLYGQVSFGLSLYSTNSTNNSPYPVWTPVNQEVISGIWTEVIQ